MFRKAILQGADFFLSKRNLKLEDCSCTPVWVLMFTCWLPIQTTRVAIFSTRGWKYTSDQVYQLLTVTPPPNHSLKGRSVICKCGHLVILNFLSYSLQYNICSENNVWSMWCSKALKTGYKQNDEDQQHPASSLLTLLFSGSSWCNVYNWRTIERRGCIYLFFVILFLVFDFQCQNNGMWVLTSWVAILDFRADLLSDLLQVSVANQFFQGRF